MPFRAIISRIQLIRGQIFTDKNKVLAPESRSIFKAGSSRLFNNKESGIFHSLIEKCLCIFDRSRPYIASTFSVLFGRVCEAMGNKNYWDKFQRVFKYFNYKNDLHLILYYAVLSIASWHDISSGVHDDLITLWKINARIFDRQHYTLWQ